MSRIMRSKWGKVLLAILLLGLANGIAASWILGSQYDKLKEVLRTGIWPIENGQRGIVITESLNQGEKVYRLGVHRSGAQASLTFDIPNQDVSPLRIATDGTGLQLCSLSKELSFEAPGFDADAIQRALREAADHLPDLSFTQRFAGASFLRPFLTGVRWNADGVEWKITTSRGSLWVGREALPKEAVLQHGEWSVSISPQNGASSPPVTAADLKKVEVPGKELSASVAEAIRIVGALVGPLEKKADEIRLSGAGWLTMRNGHRTMSLKGTPYEIGHQHGSLAPDEINRVCRRVVYGVGLLYSLKKGEWFPSAARALVERQRPFIIPAYFEEMQGLATGSGVPLDLVQMANIFPEFFHCSGVALMGEATEGGELLHARVLDYMVGIGLQDYAVVMAISRPGVNRFVTVGYLGFIGSVTGMNEKQVAIGEMGGAGHGSWDGIPMSLLIRQTLEDCNTLQEAEAFMRQSPRTCEYYYVLSDGKGPSAVGIAATADKFESFGPGAWHELLTKPVKDGVLLSGSGRYEALVERVQQNHGKITRDGLIEIIKRPVAMKSNLHNVIFQPQSLQLSVADATRNGPACDQPYRTYIWNDLFPEASSR